MPDELTYYVPDEHFDAIVAVLDDPRVPETWQVLPSEQDHHYLFVRDDQRPDLAATLPELELWDPDRHPHPQSEQHAAEPDLPVASPAALAAQASPPARAHTAVPAAEPAARPTAQQHRTADLGR